MSQTNKYLWLVTTVLLLSFALWGTRLAEPFIARHENNSAYMLIAGINYLRFGYLEYGFAPILHADPSIIDPTFFYWNHPPLGPVLASITVSLFGEHELSARLIPMFLTMLGMSAFALWLRRLWDTQIAMLGVIIFAAFPVIAYYGQMLNHEPLVLAFALMILPLLDLCRQKLDGRHLALLAFLSVMMVLSGWPALFFTGIFFLYALWIRSWPLAIVLALSTFAGILSWTVPLINIFPEFTGSLYDQFLVRSGITEQLWSSPVDFIWQIGWARWRPRFTESAAILTVLGLALLWFQPAGKHSHRKVIAYLLLLPPLLQVFVFQQQTFTHDYTVYYFAPVVALCSAITLDFLLRQSLQNRLPARMVYGIVTAILVIAFAASSVRWIAFLYTAENRFPVELAPVLQEETRPGNLIYTNDLGWQPASQYYGQRDFANLSVAPDEGGYLALICLFPQQNSANTTFMAGQLACSLEER